MKFEFPTAKLCIISLVVAAFSTYASADATVVAASVGAPPATISGSINIDLADAGTPVKPALLGSNTQWVDNGDGLLTSTGQPQMSAINSAVQIRPTVLRYPGGALSDTYHWRDGIGAYASRGSDRNLANQYQKVNFGTDEFLQLCTYLGSIPVFTINVATGDAQEAAAWVNYVNHGGSPTGQHVTFWEIGNEPYLKEDARPDLALAPAEYARRANAAILAMKAADPTIMVGIPLRSDTINGIAATPYPGFNNTVLSQITAPFDYVTVHDAYFPFVFTSATFTDGELYGAAMAASTVLAADLDATSAQLRTLLPGRNVPIAITEYNALFGLGTPQLIEYSNSLGGALYVADTLNLLSARTDVQAAFIWSLLGNGSFGVMDSSGAPRPTYYVMQAYKELLKGNRLAATVTAPSIGSTAVGAVPATNTPAISATVTREGKTLRLAVINKHSTASAAVTINLANGSAVPGGNYAVLSGVDLFAGASNRSAISLNFGAAAVSGKTLNLSLPAHSLSLYVLALN